jgi:hypothetical protein
VLGALSQHQKLAVDPLHHGVERLHDGPPSSAAREKKPEASIQSASIAAQFCR